MATDRGSPKHRGSIEECSAKWGEKNTPPVAPASPAVLELTPAMSLEEVGARVVQRFLNTGDPRGVVDEYVAALFHELAQPYDAGFWRVRSVVRPASQQLDIVLEKSAKLYMQAAQTLNAKNALTESIIRHATTNQQYELQRVTHAAAIAAQKQRKAEHDATTRRLKQQDYKDHASQAAATERAAQKLRDNNDALSRQLATERARAEQLAAALAERERQKQSAAERRTEQLAKEQHRTQLIKEKQQQAYEESRIRGLQEPNNARRRRAQRHAEHEARQTQDRTWLLDELARKADREIRRAERKHGLDHEVTQHIRNQWNTKLERLATNNGGDPE